MSKLRRIPVFNRGPDELEVGLEPEGDCLVLKAGESLEIRYAADDHDEPGIEIEVEGRLVSIHCMVDKEVWQAGRRMR